MSIRSCRRKQAYQYIYEKVKELETGFSSKIDNRSEEAEIISLTDLDKLKRGIVDPTDELITVLKKLLRPVASEDEIEENLVKPFQPVHPHSK